jgi:hypothetical protein
VTNLPKRGVWPFVGQAAAAFVGRAAAGIFLHLLGLSA